MTLNAKIGDFMDFLPLSGWTQVYIIHKEAPRYYYYVHFGMTVIKVFYFIENSRKFDSNSDRFSLYDFVVF